jgi:hypothetical protein
MTSTLSVVESLLPHRPYDPRTPELMTPDLRTAYLALRAHIDSEVNWPFKTVVITNAESFEKAFVDAGGLLAAGCDPTGIGGNPPGLGDQRNYELLIEAGLTPAQVVQILTANGAKILGAYDHVGSIEPGRPRRHPHRRSHGDSQGDHGLQGRRRLRLPEAHRIGKRTPRHQLIIRAPRARAPSPAPPPRRSARRGRWPAAAGG